MVENIAAAIFLNGSMEDCESMRSQSRRLIAVLNTFLSTVPRDMIQPPHGKYSMVFDAVMPLYARICCLKGELQKARDLWETGLQYQLVTEGSRWPRTQAQLMELLEAADVDSKLGCLDSAIEKYISVIRRCEPGMLQKDNIIVRASSSFRETREIHARRERDFQRAIAAQRSTEKASEELNETSEMEDGEWELITRYEEAPNLFGPKGSETLQHATALDTHYKDISRTDKEEVYREVAWKY